MQMVSRSIVVSNAKILILGITFKENCPDIRNSKVIDIYNSLKKFNLIYVWLIQLQITKNKC